ncbi:hypothetical protein [Actinocrispum wychmicini]|uniref:Uncharacterized protein n=1 Tax=Actinocrispum wychmicini TaxID=1213861 RepID=A0A4R2J8L1_9PSEU|nr:hypothetical protein [Actinocrispum wychmicini]TCO55621.1 hypothetical protein EV192_10742 [Actinocrispum wychmicini]
MAWHDEHARHQRYRDERDRIVELWSLQLAGPSGPLAGAILDPAPLPIGWCGQVQLVPGRHSIRDVQEAAPAIESAYGTPRDAVVVEESRTGTADQAFVWAFHTTSAADHHRNRPMSTRDVHGRGNEPAPPRAEPWESEHLADWAGKYAFSYTRTRAIGGVSGVSRFVRRLARLRGGILDLLPRTDPGHVQHILTEKGVTSEMLPDDLAEILELPRRGGQDRQPH